jgi:hypothetical protein
VQQRQTHGRACIVREPEAQLLSGRARCREMLLNGFYDVKWSSLRRSEHVSALEIERRRYSKSEIINGKDAVDSVQRKKWVKTFLAASYLKE